MIPIYCSNKLAKLLGAEKLVSAADVRETPFGGWNAQLFTVDRRKCLAFVQNQSYYTVFFADILKKDLKDFHSFFVNRLLEQLMFDHIISLKQISYIKEIHRSILLVNTNNDKKTIGTLNDRVYSFKVYKEYKYDSLDQMDLVYENSLINDCMTRPKEGPRSNYAKPKIEMKKLIEACGGK